MATIRQIRAMFLEEAVLHLLRTTGYRTVDEAGDDRCLHDGPAGIEVLGRGGKHQIDAIADFIIAQPFSNPQRLLVEAKFYRDTPANLTVARNALGVLKDVGEFWAPDPETAPKARYHYQYAVFSATGFTAPAEDYAFVQDIYLIPLEDSAFIRPILDAIGAIDHTGFAAPSDDRIPVRPSRLRQQVRARLRGQAVDGLDPANNDDVFWNHARAQTFLAVCQALDGALLAMLGGRFPIFLVPAPNVRISDFAGEHNVHIFWDQNGWYIRRPGEERNLFSFDLPPKLLGLFQRGGLLSPRRALDLKELYLSDFQAIAMVDRLPRVVFFRLDPGWLDRVRGEAEEKRQRRRPLEGDDEHG